MSTKKSEPSDRYSTECVNCGHSMGQHNVTRKQCVVPGCQCAEYWSKDDPSKADVEAAQAALFQKVQADRNSK